MGYSYTHRVINANGDYIGGAGCFAEAVAYAKRWNGFAVVLPCGAIYLV